VGEYVLLFGLKISKLDMMETIEEMERLIAQNKSSMVFTPNVQRVVEAQKNKHIKNIYDHADLLLPDGMPLVWASKIFGNSLKERIAGSDLFPLFCKISSEKGFKLFFLGAGPGIAKKAKEVLTNKYPDLKIVGTYSPSRYFGNDLLEIEKIVGIIKEKKPDVLFVGLGFPKEEHFISNYKDKYEVPLSIGIGASFDFVAGNIKRAPKWLQNLGLEWFYRLIREPKRLWQRYLIGNTIFVYLTIMEFFRSKILKRI